MKAFKGWLTAKDPATKTEVPFFVRTRSQDIEILNPIDIEKKLIKTSNIYTLSQRRDFIDYSMYAFTADSKSIYGVTMKKAYIEYRLYRDGSYTINGTVRIPKTSSKAITEIENLFLTYQQDLVGASSFIRFPLPYGLLGSKINDIFHVTTFSDFLDIKCGRCYGSGDSADAGTSYATMKPCNYMAFIPTLIDDADLGLRLPEGVGCVHEIIALPIDNQSTGNKDYVVQFNIKSRYTTDINEN